MAKFLEWSWWEASSSSFGEEAWGQVGAWLDGSVQLSGWRDPQRFSELCWRWCVLPKETEVHSRPPPFRRGPFFSRRRRLQLSTESDYVVAASTESQFAVGYIPCHFGNS